MESRRQKICSVIFILTPIIAALITCLATQTNLLQLDAYNTTLNDEVGYLRGVRTIRSQGMPTGVAGYNEAVSDIPAYGGYTIFTFIPYVLVSFLTGISAANFMYYCNVIMIVIANIIFVCLAKPSTRQFIWLILFSGLSLVYERYVWSGMTEASHCAFVIVLLGCTLWLYADHKKAVWKERTVLLLMTALTLYFGMVRPFQFVWLLIPVFYLIQNSKSKTRWLEILGIAIAAVVCYVLYSWLTAHWSAPYFSNGGISEMLSSYLTMLQNGQFGGIIRNIIAVNIDALKTAFSRLTQFKFVGIVVTVFFINEIVLLAQTIHSGLSKDHRQTWLTGLCFAIGMIIYEVNIVLYTIDQCHRMLLSFLVFSGYLICMSELPAVIKGGRQVVETGIISIALFTITSSFALPQRNDAVDVDTMEQELAQALPFDEENKWGNTIAKVVETRDMYVTFCLPTYMNYNSCLDDYLEQNITDDSMKSKYILLTDDHKLNKLCQEKYEVVWQGYGHIIYLNDFYDGSGLTDG